MKYIDEFKDLVRGSGILKEIVRLATFEVSFMEICGSHTHTACKSGLRAVLPDNINLISGPGCPVCVTSQPEIDAIVDFADSNKEVVITTFGDMLKVPGSSSTLEQARARASDVRVVYSPLGALSIARQSPEKEVVLLSVGFETTVPLISSVLQTARGEGITNLTVYPLHKLTPPAMAALLDSKDMRIDGFICPGHVTAIIGAGAYGFIAKDYNRPCVVAGFEPLDLLFAIYMLLLQLKEGRADIENEYKRVVSGRGNERARAIMDQVFEPGDALWRGLGSIPMSGLSLRDDYMDFSAARRFGIDITKYMKSDKATSGCRCADVLRGVINPPQCPLFASVCTPTAPQGPCMVSDEGACAAWYTYERTAVAL